MFLVCATEAAGADRCRMKRINELLDSAAARVRRSLFKRREAESYGELIWLMDPEAEASQPRRPWRQDLDRMSVTRITPLVESARHKF
jgi:hypothetical protein